MKNYLLVAFFHTIIAAVLYLITIVLVPTHLGDALPLVICGIIVLIYTLLDTVLCWNFLNSEHFGKYFYLPLLGTSFAFTWLALFTFTNEWPKLPWAPYSTEIFMNASLLSLMALLIINAALIARLMINMVEPKKSPGLDRPSFNEGTISRSKLGLLLPKMLMQFIVQVTVLGFILLWLK